jgi:protein phosphatase
MAAIPRRDILLGHYTHVGMERSENQDFYGYYEPEDDAEFALKGRVIIVCDGMGGHAGGEVASRLAVQTIIETYKADTTGNVPELLRASIEAANRAIWKHASENPPLKGMGSTCVSMAIKDGIAYFGHVGDSRCYLVRQEQLVQMTQDHSLVQQMVNEGLLREEEMESHPEKNVILRSLGVKPDVDVEVNYYQLQPGDIYCLSTDGLTGLVSKEECRRICIMNKDTPQQGAQLLVDLANKYGGYDNITVQMVRIMALSPNEVPASAAAVGTAAMPSPGAPPASAGGGGTGGSTTGVYSEDEVARSIAEARAKASGGADMLAGAQKKAPPQKGVTVAIEGMSKEEAMAAAMAERGGPAAPAPAKGGGKGLLVGALVGVLIVGGAGVFGINGAMKTGAAKANLERTIEDAKKKKLEEKKEYKAAQDALKSSEGFLGGITGAGALEKAESDLRKVLESANKSSSATLDEAQAARKQMLAVREPAAAAGAGELAAAKPAWERGEAATAEAEAALGAGDHATAVARFQAAEAAFNTALEAAQAAQVALAADEKKN